MAIDAAAPAGGVPAADDVAVIIAVKNGAQYIAEAVETALARPCVSEVVVVDDGSTDATRQVVAAIEERRVRLVVNASRGVSSARNQGASLTKARWLLFLDADDRLVAGGVEALLAKAGREPKAVMVYGDYERIAADGRRIGKRFLMRRREKPSGNILKPLLAGNFIINGGVALVRRDIFDAIEGFSPSLTLCEDWHLWCRLAAMGEVAYAPALVMDYRVHTTSIMMHKRRHFEDFKPAVDAIFADPLIEKRVSPDDRAAIRPKAIMSLKAYCAAQIYRSGARAEGIGLALGAIRDRPDEAPRVLLRFGAAMAGF